MLGNLHAYRDWGHSKDYVRAMFHDFESYRGRSFGIENGSQELLTLLEICVIAVFDKLDLDYRDYVEVDKDILGQKS